MFHGSAKWAHAVLVNSDGVLGRLLRISKTLSGTYGWNEAEANTFVLTGTVFPVASLRVWVRRRFPMRVGTRIVLEVHPSCTPREVAEAYGRTRKQEFGRVRRLSAKHAWLAQFYFRHRHLPLPDIFSAWNKECADRGRQYGKWSYRSTRVQQFKRDGERAISRLLELGGRRAS